MYCAWPPWRCGGVTSNRAAWLATSAPWWSRTSCRQQSIAATVPAEVMTLPSATYSTSGRNFVFGKRSEEHTSELQSLMRISYAVFCLKKKNKTHHTNKQNEHQNYR